MATLDSISAQVADLLAAQLVQQSEVAAMRARLEELAGFESYALRGDMHTNGHAIVGPPVDPETEQAEPVRVTSYGDALYEAGGRNVLNHVAVPQVLFEDLPALLAAGDDGKCFSFAGAESVALGFATGTALAPPEAPPVPSLGAEWNVFVRNVSTTPAADITVNGGAVTLNGSGDTVTISPGEGRWIMRAADGYWVL